jgi:hypothetical protein
MSTYPRKHRPVWIAAAFLVVTAMAGCGRHDDPGVATANSSAPQAGASTAAGGPISALKYSQCMRDQGLTWFPDPGTDGGLKVSVPQGTSQATFDKAEQACKAFAPSAQHGGKISADDLAKLRQMAQCIRDKGFAKYPDPDANGGISIDEKTTGISPADPAFDKALQECRKYLPPQKNRTS